MDEELQRVIEAILFAAARKLELADIAKLCKRTEQDVLAVLNEWKGQLDKTDSPTMLVQDNTAWKLTVREKYVQVIKKVVTKMELPKSLLETLSVVAYKSPVLQSKVIKIRTNKAYDHLNQLENSGFITREKSGRTKLIKLTPKFFEYFDIDPKKLKEKFSGSGDVEKAIEQKEKEIEQIEVDRQSQTEEQLAKPQIVLHTDTGEKHKLETYPSVEPVAELEPTGVQVFMEKLGDLQVFEVPKESMKPEEIAELEHEAEHPHHKHHKKKSKRKHPHSEHHEPRVPKEHKEKPAEKPPAEEVAEAAAKVEEELKGKPEAAEAKTEAPSEPQKQLTPEEKIRAEAAAKASKLKERKFEEGEGIKVTPEMETEIEQKVKRILGQTEEKKE